MYYFCAISTVLGKFFARGWPGRNLVKGYHCVNELNEKANKKVVVAQATIAAHNDKEALLKGL